MPHFAIYSQANEKWFHGTPQCRPNAIDHATTKNPKKVTCKRCKALISRSIRLRMNGQEGISTIDASLGQHGKETYRRMVK